MKKYLLLLALLSVSLVGLGQEPEEPISLDGSISSDIGSGKSPNRNQNGFESTVAKQLPIGVRSWRIDEHLCHFRQISSPRIGISVKLLADGSLRYSDVTSYLGLCFFVLSHTINCVSLRLI